MGRPRTCDCGGCRKCKQRENMARWWARKTPEEKRAIVARRNREKIRAADRARYARDKEKVLEQNRRWREENPEKVAEQKRRWAAANRERLNECSRRWGERNPEKRKAQTALATAVRAGRVTREPCEVCGTAPAHGHHDDYSKPLEVRWLCPEHHSQVHKELRRAA